MKKGNFWKRLSIFMRAFLILAFAFLVVGFATVGTGQSTGAGYVLPVKKSTDEKQPCIVLSIGDAADENFKQNFRLQDIYINLGTIYNNLGEKAKLKVYRSSSASSVDSFTNNSEIEIGNLYSVVEKTVEGSTEKVKENLSSGASFNWIRISDYSSTWSSSGYSSTYSHFKITAETCNVMINEIVFVGYDDSLPEEERELFVIPAKVNSISVLYDLDTGAVSGAAALKQASAVVDSPSVPSFSQSTFFRYSEEEAYSLMTVGEMRFDSHYYRDGVYHGDKIYNSFGIDILSLGTAIFGMSPFGLRFFPMLASFGVLVFGFLFVRRLLKSDKAGFVFAVLYALSGAGFTLGHLGTPLMIGLCFFVASLYFCFLFVDAGMKKADFKSALPLLFSGLLAAAAVCVNGAFLIPVVGLVGLFVYGLVRMNRARRYYLDLAIAEAEEEERMPKKKPVPAEEGAEEPVSGRQKVANVLNEYHYKRTVSIAVFGVMLVFGFLAITMLGIIPVYFTYQKMYGNGSNVLALAFKAFAGGYAGSNFTLVSSSPWSFFYTIFKGTGEIYAVTGAGLLPAIIPVASGLFGLVIAILRLVQLFKGGRESIERGRRELRSVLILLGGLVLSLVTTAFAKGGLAFMLLSYLFAFALAAYSEKNMSSDALSEGRGRKIWIGVQIAWLAVSVVCFALFAIFTFSVPVSATFMGQFFG